MAPRNTGRHGGRPSEKAGERDADKSPQSNWTVESSYMSSGRPGKKHELAELDKVEPPGKQMTKKMDLRVTEARARELANKWNSEEHAGVNPRGVKWKAVRISA